jgi:NADPH:quinone reductase-like Zn-dependent oxidoreductase
MSTKPSQGLPMRVAINDQYGNPDVLRLSEAPTPKVGPHEVLVQVLASDVTQGDRRLRAADFPGFTALFGRLMFGVFSPRNPVGGTNFAGRVASVGSKVTDFAVGDDVFGAVMGGAYAEYLSVPEKGTLAKMPAKTTYSEAAALPYGAVTALVFLRDLAKVQPGERVLVVGASGGVGRMAVQLAKHLGAHVTGVASRDEDLVRSLGASDFIDHRSEDFTESGKTWDVIFDATEGNHFRAFRGSLTPAGRYLTLYMTIRVLFEKAVTAMRGGQRAIVGVAMGSAETLRDIRELASEGALRAVIGERYSLEQIASAHAALEDARPRGSVIVEMVDVQSPRAATGLAQATPSYS